MAQRDQSGVCINYAMCGSKVSKMAPDEPNHLCVSCYRLIGKALNFFDYLGPCVCCNGEILNRVGGPSCYHLFCIPCFRAIYYGLWGKNDRQKMHIEENKQFQCPACKVVTVPPEWKNN